MLILSAKEQKQLLDMNGAIEAVALALGEFSRGRTVTPERTFLPLERYNGTALFMPSYVEASRSLGVKFVSVYPGNKEKNKETIYGVMILADVETGEPLAMLEASHLTMLRTGAASGLATQYLARDDAGTLAVIGTGRQARGVVEAILCVRQIREIRLYNPTEAKAHRFAQEIRTELKDRCPEIRVMDDADRAAKEADILVTATNSATPVFSPEAVGPGVHINGIGAFRPTMQEIPSAVVGMADKVVVESVQGALEESGDLIIPIREGNFSADRIYAELGELVNGTKAKREHEREITLFKSVGLAVMDVVVAKAIYDRAVAAGAGREVQIYD